MLYPGVHPSRLNCLESNENVIARLVLLCVVGIRHEVTCTSDNQGPWQDNHYLRVFGQGNKSFEGLFTFYIALYPYFDYPSCSWTPDQGNLNWYSKKRRFWCSGKELL
jgi:hypothetical protein